MKFPWDVQLSSRFVTAEEMRVGDIALKLRDGRLFLVGSEGLLHSLHWWDRLLYVVLG